MPRAEGKDRMRSVGWIGAKGPGWGAECQVAEEEAVGVEGTPMEQGTDEAGSLLPKPQKLTLSSL